MNIMVYDIAAESGGALSVLNDFYTEFKTDKSNKWIFVISKPELKETENVKVLRYTWIKKSWLHRLFFDYFIAPKLIIEYKIDKVFSLQNTIVPHSKVHQTVYVHNSLPFVEYRFNIFEDFLLWVYQNVISKSIFNSIKKADKVIVQTNWMKNVCVEKLKVSDKKIEVMPPKINFKVKKYFQPTEKSLTTFFYPASGVAFKNHKIILEACGKLKDAKVTNFKVIVTLDGNENENISKLYNEAKEREYPIEFIGSIKREKVFELYSNTTLLFPSYVESSPLPLSEAKLSHSIILASDCSFSHEILDDYKNAYYFNPFDENELSMLMENIIKQKIDYFEPIRQKGSQL